VDCSFASNFNGLIGPIGVWPNFLPLQIDGQARATDYEKMYFKPWVLISGLVGGC
jgi:hypothetical protein